MIWKALLFYDVHAAAVHTGVISKGYSAPQLDGAYAGTADSSSPQSVAQFEVTVSVKSGAKRAPYALSADSSHQSPAQRAELPMQGVESHEQALHAQAQHAQHGLTQHELAQREPAHQSAQDMLSSRWANAPWATTLTAYLSQPDAQYASQHTASKPVADSSRTPLPPGRGNPQNSKTADDAMSRPGVATRIPNALFGSAPQMIKAVPRQVSSCAASWLSKPGQQVQLSELGQNSKASFGSAAQQQPAAGSASLSHPLLPGSKAATGPVSTALLPGGAAAAGVPLLPTGKAAGGATTAHLLSAGKAAAADPEAVSAPLLPAGKGVAGAGPALLLPTDQTAAAAVKAAPVPNGIATAAAAATPLLPAGKTAPTANLLPSSNSAVSSFMRPCSKPWGVNKGGRAGGLSKTLGVPRGANGSRGTGVAQQEKVAKTGKQACSTLYSI